MVTPTPLLRFCHGLESEHATVVGDGKSGKNYFVREKILKRLPRSKYKCWCWDHNGNGFNGVGTPVRSINGLLDANVQYFPQVNDEKEFIEFLEKARRLGGLVTVLDEFQTKQSGRRIAKPIEYFLQTARHAPRSGISWITITQSPLKLNDVVFHNVDHVFAFYMKRTSRHIDWYYEKFDVPMTMKLAELHFEAKARGLARPYIYDGPGVETETPILYSHQGNFVYTFGAKGEKILVKEGMKR